MAEQSAGKDTATGHWEMTGLVTPTPVPHLSRRASPGGRRAVRGAHRPQGPRQQGRLRHRDPEGAGRGAPAHRLAHPLHLGRQRVPGRGARGPRPARRALPHLPHRLRDRLPAVRRLPRHRAALRGHDAADFKRTPEPPRLPGAARRARPCSTAWPRAGCPSSAWARSRTSSPAAASAAPCTRRPTPTAIDQTLKAMAEVDRGLVFTNLVDFDTLYGHRNDVPGYAANLELLDAAHPRDPGRAARGRRLPAHRRPRLRSLGRLHRPHPRARAPARPRARGCGRARTWASAPPSPTSGRPWPRTSASGRSPRAPRSSQLRGLRSKSLTSQGKSVRIERLSATPMLVIDVSQHPARGPRGRRRPSTPGEVHLEGEESFALAGGTPASATSSAATTRRVHVRGHLVGRAGPPVRPLPGAVRAARGAGAGPVLPAAPARRRRDEEEDEVELCDRDMVVAYYRGDRLDLGEMIREQLFLAVPHEAALPRGLPRACARPAASTATRPRARARPEGRPRALAAAKLFDKGAS